MIRLNVILGLKHSSRYLILILVWISSLMVHSSIIQGTNYVPLQASETTWDLLESDFPDAVFRDVSFLNSTHGWVAGRATSELSSNAIVLHTKNGGDSWQT
ncbi:MAG: hypothetical protein ACXAEN_14890, partial [Candidatus Thorarchaeota archaeon]